MWIFDYCSLFQDIEHIENGEIPMLDKKSWTSRSLRGIWGKRSNTPTKRGNKFVNKLLLHFRVHK